MIQSTVQAALDWGNSVDPMTLTGLALGWLVLQFAGIVAHHTMVVNAKERERLARDYWGLSHDPEKDMER